jgi:hypothetical protein
MIEHPCEEAIEVQVKLVKECHPGVRAARNLRDQRFQLAQLLLVLVMLLLHAGRRRGIISRQTWREEFVLMSCVLTKQGRKVAKLFLDFVALRGLGPKEGEGQFKCLFSYDFVDERKGIGGHEISS